MGRSQRGYNSYRGRRSLTDVLKIVAAVLGVLVVLLLAALWLSRGENGFPLKLPILSQQEDEPSGSGQDVQGEGTDPAGTEGEPEEPASSEEEPEQESALTALELPLSAIQDGSAAAQLEQAGANALVLTMKDEEGMLAWDAQQSLARSCGVNAADGAIQEQLVSWNQGEVYTVARVCCFRDNTIPYHRNDLAMRASYGNWRDEEGLRWLNPASEGAQTYLADLCGELAAMGFDEILLECPGFPTAGSVEAITSGDGSREETVSAFQTRVEEAVAPYETRVSLRVEAGTLTGILPESGVTAALLEKQAGRIWVDSGEEEDLSEILLQVGVTAAQERLVEIVPQIDPDAGCAQAKLTG